MLDLNLDQPNPSRKGLQSSVPEAFIATARGVSSLVEQQETVNTTLYPSVHGTKHDGVPGNRMERAEAGTRTNV